MHRSAGTFAVVALFSGAALSACAKEGAKSDSAVAQTGSAVKAAYDPATHVATVIARDFAFEAPDTIAAGWVTFHMMNEGPTLHHAGLVRIDSGKTMADVEAALKKAGPPPGWLVEVGGPNAPDPGAESNGTVHLDPGQYALICFVNVPGNVPHFMKGMVRPLFVQAASGTAAAAAEPTFDATITLSDYSFNIEGKLGAGKHTIRVLNQGPQTHEVEILRFAPGKTVKDFAAWLDKPEGPPPASALGGIVGVAKGTMASYFDVDLTPASYALLCFIPDAKDQKPHLLHGMIKELTVE